MSATLRVNQHGRLTIDVVHKGRRDREGTNFPDTDAHRARLAPILAKINAEIRAGIWNDARYLVFFPHGNRAAEIRAKLDDGELNLETFTDYAARWLVRRQADVSHKTWLVEGSDINRLGAMILDDGRKFGDVFMGRVNPRIVNDLRSQLLKRVAVKTVKNMLGSTLSAIFRDAARIDGIISTNPVAELIRIKRWPRIEKPTPDPFNDAEREEILKRFRGKRYERLVTFLFWTGCRPSEAAGLRWADVDLTTGTATFKRSRVRGRDGATKTAGSARTIDLIPEAVAALRACQPLHAAHDLHVFLSPMGKPIDQDRVARDWNQTLLVEPQIRQRGLYECRATFISMALNRGLPVQLVAEYCGNSPAIIAKHYARWIPPTGGGNPMLRLSETVTVDSGGYKKVLGNKA